MGRRRSIVLLDMAKFKDLASIAVMDIAALRKHLKDDGVLRDAQKKRARPVVDVDVPVVPVVVNVRRAK